MSLAGKRLLLDCTLRDGGYINDWEFGHDKILEIFKRLVSSNVDFIEIGFIDDRRLLDLNRTIMPDTDAIDKIFSGLNKGNAKIVGMIDYGTCDIKNIKPCKESFIDGIRVIYKQHVAKEALSYCGELKKLGYFTYLTTNGTCLESVKQAIPYIDSLKVSFNYLLNGSNDIHEITRTNYIPITKIIDNINIFAKECKKYNTEFALSTVIDESKYNKESHSKTMDYLFPNIFHYYIPLQTQGGYNNKGLGGVVGETESKVNQIPCWSLFKGLYIDADLNVRTCCYGHTDKHILGNIKDMKVVNKKELLQQHLSNQIPDICKECIKNK